MFSYLISIFDGRVAEDVLKNSDNFGLVVYLVVLL